MCICVSVPESLCECDVEGMHWTKKLGIRNADILLQT